MPLVERQFKITANDFVKAGEVSIEVQSMLKKIGFDPGDHTAGFHLRL